MPSTAPCLSRRTPVLSAARDASASDRSIGTWPTPAKNLRESQPLIPGVVKYSAFARNVTLRGTISGMKNESEKDRWLLARIAGPRAGTCSIPSVHGSRSQNTGVGGHDGRLMNRGGCVPALPGAEPYPADGGAVGVLVCHGF